MDTNTVTRKPDPDGMNGVRAMDAEAALRLFCDATGVDDEDALCDLLANLMHLSDARPDKYGTFDDQLDRAVRHYRAETTGHPL